MALVGSGFCSQSLSDGNWRSAFIGLEKIESNKLNMAVLEDHSIRLKTA